MSAPTEHAVEPGPVDYLAALVELVAGLRHDGEARPTWAVYYNAGLRDAGKLVTAALMLALGEAGYTATEQSVRARVAELAGVRRERSEQSEAVAP